MKYFFLIIIGGLGFSTTLYAQKVRINYPFGLTKISADQGRTWTIQKQRKVTFHYPFGTTKTSLDNGRSWTQSSLDEVVFVYPDQLRKSSTDKGKTWLTEKLHDRDALPLKVFPNPAGAYTRITLEGYEWTEQQAPKLFTLSGQPVALPAGSYRQVDGVYYLHTESLRSGFYCLRFKNKEGYRTAKIQVLH